jgi:hypothetical protein
LVKVLVDLKLEAKKQAGAGVKFEYLLPVEATLKRQWTTTHRLGLTLTPAPARPI